MGKLTVKQINAAQPQAKDVYLRDGDGLELRIYPSGKRTWQFRYLHGEKRMVIVLGSHEHLSLKDARIRTQNARKLLDQGIDPKAHAQEAERARLAKLEAERIERESRRLFRPTVERWIELEISRRKGDATKEMMRSFTKDIFPALGERELGNIKRGDLMDVLDTIKARGSNVQANRTLSSLKQFFNWCVMREYIEANPLALVKKTKVGGQEKERKRVLSDSEMQELRDKLPNAGMERSTELAIWIMLSTASRKGEIIQARREHIDLNAGTWMIPASNAKNDNLHTVNLSSFARRHFEELRSIHHWSDWVMPSPKKKGHHVNKKNITKQVGDRQTDIPLSRRSKAVDALILSGGTWTPHDLRRTASTVMRSLGTSSDVIERCLNHTEQNKLVKVYQQADLSDEMRTAWLRLGERLDEVLNGTERKVLSFKRVA